MKIRLLYLFLSSFLVCCNQSGSEPEEHLDQKIVSLVVPSNEINKSELIFNTKNSLWTFNSEPFSGYAESYSEDSILIQRFGILNGRKQNESLDWYPDGHLKYAADYHKGKLHGEKKIWSYDSNHVLVAHYNYYLGKAHGTQKKWYPTGEIFKILQMTNGKEDGIQQAFRENGKLYTNYEAKDGRIFGLKRSTLCFELEDGKINRKRTEESEIASNN